MSKINKLDILISKLLILSDVRPRKVKTRPFPQQKQRSQIRSQITLTVNVTHLISPPARWHPSSQPARSIPARGTPGWFSASYNWEWLDLPAEWRTYQSHTKLPPRRSSLAWKALWNTRARRRVWATSCCRERRGRLWALHVHCGKQLHIQCLHDRQTSVLGGCPRPFTQQFTSRSPASELA